MKYISIDTETSGLIPEKCNVIQFGAVLEDTALNLPINQLPTFEVLLEWPEYRADSTWALRQHTALWDRLEKAKGKKDEDLERQGIIKPWQLGEQFYNWLIKNNVIEKKGEPIVVAGKNFASFDWQHLKHVPRFFDFIQFSHKVIDPAMLYWDPINDKRLPSLPECKKRAGMLNEDVAHTSVADAIDVIELIRYKLKK